MELRKAYVAEMAKFSFWMPTFPVQAEQKLCTNNSPKGAFNVALPKPT